MKSAGKARSNGLYRHIRTSKEIIRNLLNDLLKYKPKTAAPIFGDGGRCFIISVYPNRPGRYHSAKLK